MANVVTPGVSNLHYIVVDNSNNTVITTIREVTPGTALIDNSDGLADIDGIVRGNAKAIATYIISQSVDTNGYTIPSWLPSADGGEDYQGFSADQLDSLLILYRDYYTVNIPTNDYSLNLQGGVGVNTNEGLNDGTDNIYLVQIQELFSDEDYVFSVITN